MLIRAGTKCGATLTALAVIWSPSLAHAHAGHLGELAGHSHWVGVAALAGAALVAGIASLKGRKKTAEGQQDKPVTEPSGEAEAAQ
ncbi:DUF6732 family protein [Roseibium sp.]|uniref:DUF6732 family protein n=1 Tax=Roseibium sp. TaxID=1936156 RepID=UPI003A9699B2